jgi:hypothetical protein
MVNNWDEILIDQINSLKKSGLLEISKMKIGAVYQNTESYKEDEIKKIIANEPNIELSFVKHNGGWGESETLGILKDDCDSLKEDICILYLHGKGVTQYKSEKEEPVKNWRKMMEYFLVDKWKDCIEKLDEGYDCCGVNYQNHAGHMNGETKLIYIFNGNFFWTKSNYIKKLDKKLLFEHRYSGENWICSIYHSAYSFYNTPIRINLYYETNNEYKQ